MVWSCDHVTQWVDSIGLGEYSAHLKEGGVHGGLIALDRDFDYEKLCLILQIPLTSPEVGVAMICIATGHYCPHLSILSLLGSQAVES